MLSVAAGTGNEMLPKISGCYRSHALALAVPLTLCAAQTQADVTISSGTTENIVCSGGVCAPTASSAVLNVTDLENLLASGDVRVTTTGQSVQANNIVVSDAFSWSNGNVLALDAYQSVSIDSGIAVQGQGGLALTTDDGGTNGALAFGHQGSVTFASLSSSLTINGAAYMLVNTIKSLACAVAANPSGDYGFASNFDASVDGTYTIVPVPTTFTGTFEGLGNAISNLSIDDTTDSFVGFFAEIGTQFGTGGTLRDLAVTGASVRGAGYQAGVVVGLNYGAVVNAAATGIVANATDEAGGIAGVNDGGGTISMSRANVVVNGNKCAGGLVGANAGTLSQSYASGNASSSMTVGGLTCNNSGGSVNDSYSTGSATGGRNALVGGLEGTNNSLGTTLDSYSTGKVRGGSRNSRGGFVGNDGFRGDITDSYWDTNKSKFTNLHKGAGNIKNDSGITGLTTKQLQSGLPPGFDSSIWGEDGKINGGLPYLLANPPS